MRNLWALLTKFQTLPTDEGFRELSDLQVDLMLYSMTEDAREIERARRGVTGEEDHYDSSFEDEVWNKPVGEWEVLKDGHDPNEIARQVEALTAEKDRKDLAGRFDGLEDYNEHIENGGMTSRESEVSAHIARQLAKAEERAQELTRGKPSGKRFIDDTELAGESDEGYNPLDKAKMDRAIAMFEDDDDEFTVL